ncbi:hypothetical protein NMB32_11660 [Stenotrophomonas sp. CD2]|nr:hypothetical protein NMB32_11660 [Stenotrophomonas sp. CD2]
MNAKPLILALALLCGATAPAFATSPAMTEKPSAALRRPPTTPRCTPMTPVA